MQDGIFLPVLLQLFDGQPLEKLALAAEVGLHRRDKQALTEPAGTTQEVVSSRRRELIYQCCFIYVDVAVVAQALEVLYANRIYHNNYFMQR